MEKELTIKLRLDRSQARQANAGFVADFKDAEATVTASAKSSATTQTQAAKDVAAAKKQANRDSLDSFFSAMNEQVRMAKEAANAQKQAAQDAANAQRKAVRDVTDEHQRLGSEATNVRNTLLSFVGAASAVNMVAEAGRKVLGVMADANKEGRNQLDSLLKTKDAIRDIVAMTGGKEGPGEAEVRQFMGIRTASGLSTEEARQLSLQFHGSAEAARGVNISEAEFKRIEPMIARFAAATGGGPGAAGDYGKLSGLLLGLGKFDKAEDVLAATTKFNQILSLGVGENPVLIKQAANVAGAFVGQSGPGAVKSPEELAALVATASRINPEQSGEILKSAHRVVRGFGEKWSDLLTETGITEKDTDVESLNKLFGKLEQVEKSGRRVDAYLSERGVDTHGALTLQSLYNYRGFLGNMTQQAAQPLTGGQAVSQLNAKYAADASLQIKQEQAKLDEARMNNASQLQFNTLLELRAEQALEKEGFGVASPAAKIEDMIQGNLASGGGKVGLPEGMTTTELGHKIRLERKKFEMMQEQGIQVPNRPNDTSLLGGYTSEYVNWVGSGMADQEYAAAGTEMDLKNRLGVKPPMSPIMQEVMGKSPVPGMPEPNMVPPVPGPAPAVAPNVPGPQAAATAQGAEQLQAAASKQLEAAKRFEDAVKTLIGKPVTNPIVPKPKVETRGN